MVIRNEKRLEDGLVFYRMRRGDHCIELAVNRIELEVGREVVARRLRLARARLDHLRRWGLLR